MYISVYTAALSICLTCRINDQLLASSLVEPFHIGLVQALCVLANGQVVSMKTKSYGSPAVSLSLLTNVILMFIHKSLMHVQVVRSPLEGDVSQEVMLGSST